MARILAFDLMRILATVMVVYQHILSLTGRPMLYLSLMQEIVRSLDNEELIIS